MTGAYSRIEGGVRIPVVRLSGLALTVVSWFSAAVFGAYILAFYLRAAPAHLERWNGNLPELYEPGHLLATVAIGAHMASGAVVLLLGPLQLVGAIRRAQPAVHRWIGRVFVTVAGLAGLGGLGFILGQGTIGGRPMDIGFGLYGLLMVVCAAQTWRHAAARRIETHRAWAIRLYALAIGSWLYRMDYGLWLTLTKSVSHPHGLGHTHGFRGPFDVVMAFAFYVPNLVIAELFIRARRAPGHPAFHAAAAIVLLAATGLVGIGTYYFVRYYWGPAILTGQAGR
jgi:hypothetical protein